MHWVPVVACAAAGLALFQCCGNATRGYVNSPSLFWWWVSQWLDPRAETEHGWLVLGLAGWVLRRNLSTARRATSRARGGAVVVSAALGGGLALHALGFVAQQTRVSIVAFLLFTWGVLALADRRWARAAAFPLAFMVFSIPLNALDSVGFWLRLWVIDAAELMARIGGLDLLRNGTQLLAPDGRYHYDVAAACSGVRSLMALAALALLIGYLNFRTAWRRGLMLGVCLPLTYLGNVARIAAVILAAQAGGQAWGERAHAVMGFGVFVVVVGGALGAARLLARWWPERADHDDQASVDERRAPAGGGRWRAFVAMGVVAVTVAEMFLLGQAAAGPNRGAAGVRLVADGSGPAELPAFVGTEWIGRRAEVTAVERELLPADTGFSRRNYVQVQGGVHTVFVSVVLSGRDRSSIHRPELCLVGQGWTITGTAAHRFSGADGCTVPATLLAIERNEGGRPVRKIPAVVAYWFVNSEGAVATHGARLWRDAWARVRHGRADRWAYVLVQADAADGQTAALARMQAVLDGVWPALTR